jgi:alpha-glucosidase
MTFWYLFYLIESDKEEHPMNRIFPVGRKLIIAALCAAGTVSAQSWTIYSPDSTVQATVQQANLNGTADYANATRLYYSVSHGKSSPTLVVPTSPMGITRSDRGFVDGLAFDSISALRTVDSTYTMVTGKRKNCRNYFNEQTLTFHTSSSTTVVDYEAEASANTLAGTAARRTVSGASGGQVVGDVGNGSANYLQFNGVNAPSAGSYSVVISYISGENRTASMSVNGGSATTVSFPNTGSWTTVGTVTVTITFNAGNNTIRFTNSSAYAPDFDKIGVTLSGTGSSAYLQVVLRAYDNGFAFRYRFPETSGSTYTVTGEETGIRMPSSATTCIMPYDVFDTWQNGYENYWNNNIAVGTRVSQVTICGAGASGWAMPALFRTTTGHYALFFETDVNRAYCGMHLREPSSYVYRFALPLSGEANGQGSIYPSWTLPWTMPWRVVCVGATPATILENTLSTDLATPSQVADVSWIRPGRASWSWWSNENCSVYGNFTPFIDMAQQFGWEYSLIDCGWSGMTGGTWQNLVSYAAARNVAFLFWYNSGGSHNTVPGMEPRDRMHVQSTRRSEMNTISTAGVKGIKVDFFHADKQWMIQLYLDILADAATYHLAANFHGCTMTRGWARTYPNLMSMEAVRGAEYYKYDGGYPAAQPARNTILPFTRNAVASMDFTPVGFTNMANAHVTTYAHELALSVVFESGIQHFCDQVSAYTGKSANVRGFLSTVPAAWDDTRYLLGTPGTYLVLARKKGNDWYVGGINGQSSTRSVTVPLSFLQAGPDHQMLRIADGSSNTTFSELLDTVSSTRSISVSMRARGGFVARLINMDPVAVLPGADKVNVKNVAGRSVFRCISATFMVPRHFNGKTFSLAVYALDGRLVASKLLTDRRTVDLRKELGVSGGVHVVKLNAVP